MTLLILGSQNSTPRTHRPVPHTAETITSSLRPPPYGGWPKTPHCFSSQTAFPGGREWYETARPLFSGNRAKFRKYLSQKSSSPRVLLSCRYHSTAQH